MIESEGSLPKDLPPVAHEAWRAYLSMLASKTAHFGYLESLDLKYRHGGIRSLAERARLETLLTAHDKCVAEFASQIKALGAIDQRARDLLLGLMTEAGDTGKNARQ